MKIRRDIARPMRWGPIGRPAIVSPSESVDTTLAVSFLAMEQAALQMVRERGGQLELLGSCPVDDVLRRDERLRAIPDPTGLFLNSLLVPARRRPGDPLEVRFAHRSFQEFFLAKALARRPPPGNISGVPVEVQAWVDEIAEES